MTRPTVLLDVDGVLADFVGSALALLSNRFGRTHQPHEVTEFDFSSILDWAVRDDFWRATKEPGFCSEIDPLPGALAGVAALREIADVYFVTSPMHGSQTWVHERDEWLARHFGAHHRDVLHVRRKGLVRGDMLVDDSTENVAEWCAGNPAGVGVLWAAPYNAGHVCSWADVVRIVERTSDGGDIRRHTTSRPPSRRPGTGE